MRAGRLVRSGGRGFDHFAVIMILIAYCFVGGFGGFGPAASGHVPQEMVHLPGAGRYMAVTHDVQASHRSAGEDGLHATAVFRPGLDEVAGAAPPPASKSAARAAHDFPQFATLVLNIFLSVSDALPQFETQTVATAAPAWWLRTVVLHL
jgi:hypothetical protein